MAHGKLVLFVEGQELSTFEYDDATRGQKRAKVMDQLLSSIVGWEGNYTPFRGKTFTVREVKAGADGLFGKKIGRPINLSRELQRLPAMKFVNGKATETKASLRTQKRRLAKRMAKEKTGSKKNWKDFIDAV